MNTGDGDHQQCRDSNIVLNFRGWLDQANTDFLKGRSLALDAGKRALEEAGFALPEPIYRLRFDEAAPLPLKGDGGCATRQTAREHSDTRPELAVEDAAPDTHIAKLVAEERAGQKATTCSTIAPDRVIATKATHAEPLGRDTPTGGFVRGGRSSVERFIAVDLPLDAPPASKLSQGTIEPPVAGDPDPTCFQNADVVHPEVLASQRT